MKALLIAIMLFIAFFRPTLSYAATLTVSPGSSIQDVINAAGAGDTLSLSSGSYHESIKITKPLTIMGTGDNTIIGDVVISAPTVTLKNLAVTGSSNFGIYVTGPNAQVENIYAYDNQAGGIQLQTGSDDSVVIANRLYHNGHVGIKVNSNRNLIKDNEIWDTFYNIDADGMYGFGADNTWDGNYVHDIVYNPAQNPHIDCFQTWNSPGISGTTIFKNNRCILPNTAATVDAGTSGMTINNGGSGILIIANNIFDTYVGIGEYQDFPSALSIRISNNTFIGHPTQDTPGISTGALYLNYATNIDQFTHNLVVNKAAAAIDLSKGASVTGDSNWFFTTGKPVSFVGYDASQDTVDVDPHLQSDYYLVSGSPACSAGVGAYPCAAASTPGLPAVSGDLNGDGHVDLFDYNLLVSKFGSPYTIFDYNNLVANYGK